MRVKVDVGHGGEIQFALTQNPHVSWNIKDFLQPLIAATGQFMQQQIGLIFQSFECIQVEQPSDIVLKKNTVCIAIRGNIEGLFILSLDEKVLSKMVQKFVLGDLTVEEEEEYKNDVLAESANTILGNSLKSFPKMVHANIDVPVFISSEQALIKHGEFLVASFIAQTVEGMLSLSLIIPLDGARV